MEVSKYLDSDLDGYKSLENYGTITTIRDGIVKASGLLKITSGEMVVMGGKKIKGLALNLEHNSVGIIVFGNDKDLNAGDNILRSGSIMKIGLNTSLFGRVIDGLGNDLLNIPKFSTKGGATTFQAIDTKAIGIIERKSVREPMQTGIKVVDSLIPIGCGQRELIIGDRQTGKTTIAIDSIINQRLHGYLYCVYVAVGQKRSSVARIVEKLHKFRAMSNCCVVFSSADDVAALQYLAPYAGCTIGE
jgi:F-type H+-transporting ATPase subunit alpha